VPSDTITKDYSVGLHSTGIFSPTLFAVASICCSEVSVWRGLYRASNSWRSRWFLRKKAASSATLSNTAADVGLADLWLSNTLRIVAADTFLRVSLRGAPDLTSSRRTCLYALIALIIVGTHTKIQCIRRTPVYILKKLTFKVRATIENKKNTKEKNM